MHALRAALGGPGCPCPPCPLCLRGPAADRRAAPHRHADTATLRDMLALVLPLYPILFDGTLSDKVCEACYKQVRSAYLLHLQCRDTVKLLDHYVAELQTLLNTSTTDAAKCMLLYVKDPPFIKNPTYANSVIKKYYNDVSTKKGTVELPQKITPSKILTSSKIRTRSWKNNSSSRRKIIIKQEIDSEDQDSTLYFESQNKGRMNNKYMLKFDKHAQVSVYKGADHSSKKMVKLKSKEVYTSAATQDDKRFGCELCDTYYGYRSMLVRHMQSTHPGTVIPVECEQKCKFCVTTFDDIDSYRSHLRLAHPIEPRYLCDFCPMTLEIPELLSQHEATHKAPYLQCSVCQLNCPSESILRRHMLKGHKIFYCKTCQKQFLKQAVYRQHVKQHKPYGCDICNNKFTRHVDLKRHVNTIHGAQKLPCAIRVCEYCDEKVSNLVLYEDHLRSEHPDVTPYLCDSCPDTFAAKVLLKEHQLSKTCGASRPRRLKAALWSYVCDLCNRSFTLKCSLKRHMRLMHNLIADRTKTAHTRILEITCEYCPDQFTDKTHYHKHLRDIHAAERPYQCQWCLKSFADNDSLLLHRRGHRVKGSMVRCDVCKADCRNERQHHEHLKNMHGIYNCLVCNDQFLSNGELMEHQEKHKRFICDYCGNRFINHSGLKRHMYLHDEYRESLKVKTDPSDLHKCKHCGEIFENTALVQQHVLSTHYAMSRFTCEHCGIKFHHIVNLQSHLRREHNESMLFGECDECKEKFTGGREFAKHMRTQHNAIYCWICKNHSATHKDHLQHMRDTHSNFACQHCDKKYMHKISLIDHCNSAHAEEHGEEQDQKMLKEEQKAPSSVLKKKPRNLVRCDFCDGQYPGQLALRAHVFRSHPEKRPFPCSRCGKQFRTDALRREHERAHEQLRPHRCNECGNKFVNKKALMYHERIHTGERPFACDICGARFINLNRRNAHIQTSHTLPAIPCPQCPSMFHRPGLLNHHVKKYHKEGGKYHPRRPRRQKHIALPLSEAKFTLGPAQCEESD